MLTSIHTALIGWLVFVISCFGLANALPTIDALANVTLVFNVFDNATVLLNIADNATLVFNGHNVTAGLATSVHLSSDGYVVSSGHLVSSPIGLGNVSAVTNSSLHAASSVADVGPPLNDTTSVLDSSIVASSTDPFVSNPSAVVSSSTISSHTVALPSISSPTSSVVPTIPSAVFLTRGSGEDQSGVVYGLSVVATVTETVRATITTTITLVNTVTCTPSAAPSSSSHPQLAKQSSAPLAPLDESHGEVKPIRKSLVEESLAKRIAGLTFGLFANHVAECGIYRTVPDWKTAPVQTGTASSRIDENASSQNESLIEEPDVDPEPTATVKHQDINAASRTSTTSSHPSSGPWSTSCSTPCPSHTCAPPPICTADAELASCLASQLAAEQALSASQYADQQEQQRLSVWQSQNLRVLHNNNAQAAAQAEDLRRQRMELAHRYQLVLQNDPTGLVVYTGPPFLPAATETPMRSFSALLLCCGVVGSVLFICYSLRQLSFAAITYTVSRWSNGIGRRCHLQWRTTDNDSASLQIACRSPRPHWWMPSTTTVTVLYALAKLQVVFSASDAFASQLAKFHPVVYIVYVSRMIICTHRNNYGSSSISIVDTWVRVWAPRLILDSPYVHVESTIRLCDSPKSPQTEDVSPVVEFVFILSVVIMGTFSIFARLMSSASHVLLQILSVILADILGAVFTVAPQQTTSPLDRMESESATISPFSPETDSDLEVVSSASLQTPSPSPACTALVRTSSRVLQHSVEVRSDQVAIAEVASLPIPSGPSTGSEVILGHALLPSRIDAALTFPEITTVSDTNTANKDDTAQDSVEDSSAQTVEITEVEDEGLVSGNLPEGANAEVEDSSEQLLLPSLPEVDSVDDNAGSSEQVLLPSQMYDTASSIEILTSTTTYTAVTPDGAPTLSSPASEYPPLTTTSTENAIQDADPPASVEPLVTHNDETERDAENDNATFSTGSTSAAAAEVVRAIVISSVAEVERHLEHESTVATIAETASSVAVPLESAQAQGEAPSRIAQQETENPKATATGETAASLQGPEINIGHSARISTSSSVRPAVSKTETHDNQQHLAPPSTPVLRLDDTSRSAQSNSSLNTPVQQETVDVEMRIVPASLSLSSDSLRQSDSGRIAQAPDGRFTLIVDDPMQGDQEDVEMEEAVEQESGIIVMEDDLNVEDDTDMETDDLVVETDVVMVGADIPTSTLAHITAPETPVVNDVDMEGDSVEVEHDVMMDTVGTQAANNQPPAQAYAPEAVMEDVIAQNSVTQVVERAPIATTPPQENVPARVPDVEPVQAPAPVVQTVSPDRSIELAQVVAPLRREDSLSVAPVVPAAPSLPAFRPVQAIRIARPVASAVRDTMQRSSTLASPLMASTAALQQNGNPSARPHPSAAPAVWHNRPEAPLFMPKKKPIPAASRTASATASSSIKQGMQQAGSSGNEKLWNLTKPQDPTRPKTIHAAKTSSGLADHQFKIPALPLRPSRPAPVAPAGTLAASSSSISATPPRSQAVHQAVLPAALTPLVPLSAQRLSLATSSTYAAEEEEMNAMPRPSPPPAYAMPRNAAELAKRDQEETQRIIAEFRAKKAANDEGDTRKDGGTDGEMMSKAQRNEK